MRDEFPIFLENPDWVYLDSAATAQKPKCVIDAITDFYAKDYATVHRAIYQKSLKASDLYHQSRVKAAEFLNAEASEIVFTKNTTSAINLVAGSFASNILKNGDEILISEMEHHSNIVPWQMIARMTGAKIKYIPMNEQGVLEWEGFVNEKTKIASIAHISNVTGTINPIKEMAKAVHGVGGYFCVDGAQAAPVIKIDVKDLDVDFYAFSSHKCYGPTGVGVLFGKRELLKIMPPIEGGGDMIEEVNLTDTSYQPPPLRFEAGTPTIASVVALKTALEFVERYRSLKKDLTQLATSELKKFPNVQIIGLSEEKGPIITFHIEGAHPMDIAAIMDSKNISIRSGHLCAQPLLKKFGLSSAARISFGVYNTKEDVSKFIQALEEALLTCKR